MTAVRAAGLLLRYGPRTALDGVSFEVAAGEVVGLLGPNGAGKTTALSVLATLRRPEAGDAEVAGISVRRDAAGVRRVLGLVPQSLAVYPTLTALENLRCFAGILGLAGRAARDAMMHALDLVGLAERATDVVATFSGGMQRRRNQECALLHRPAVLLLDEPTVRVDPQSRERILETARPGARRHRRCAYSTHPWTRRAPRDHVVLIDHGRVVAGQPAEPTRGGGDAQPRDPGPAAGRLARRHRGLRCRSPGSSARGHRSRSCSTRCRAPRASSSASPPRPRSSSCTCSGPISRRSSSG
jgi:ABC-2 type transport system ATP-binding protein